MSRPIAGRPTVEATVDLQNKSEQFCASMKLAGMAFEEWTPHYFRALRGITGMEGGEFSELERNPGFAGPIPVAGRKAIRAVCGHCGVPGTTKKLLACTRCHSSW